MGKIVTIPTGVNFNKLDIDIGAVNDIGGNQLDISTITVTDVKNVIGVSSTNISSICNSPNVNRYSLFSPDTTAPHSLGDFAGYNHNALPPTRFYSPIVSPLTLDKEKVSTSEYYTDVYFSLQRGEKYPTNVTNSTKDTWDYVKVKMTFSGSTFTITGSTTVSVGNDTTPSTVTGGYVRLTDSSHITRNGILIIEAKYMTSTNIEIASIEDTHANVTFTANGVYNYYYSSDYNNFGLAQAYTRFYNVSSQSYRTELYGNYSINLAPQIHIYENAVLPTTVGNSINTYIMRYQYYTQNGSDFLPINGQMYELFDCFYITGFGNWYKVNLGTKYILDDNLGDILFKTDVCYSATIKKVNNLGDS